VFVNGRQVRRANLRHGDVVCIGTTEIRVRTVSRSRQITAEGERDASIVARPQRASDRTNALETIAYLDRLDGDRDGSHVREQARKFALLYEVARSVQSEPNADAMLARATELLLLAVRGDRVIVALEDDSGALVVRAVRDRSGVAQTGTVEGVTLSRTIANLVVRDRCVVTASDTRLDTRLNDSPSLATSLGRSIVAVPITAGDHALGLVQVESVEPVDRFGESAIDLLSVAASLLGVALQNVELAARREQTITELQAAQRQLVAAQEQLVRAEQFAAIGRLASGIAHEVKNQLSPFMLADLIAERHRDDRTVQEATEMMLEAQRHILGLVNEIRTFASGGGAPAERVDSDLVSLARGTIRFATCDAVVKRQRVSLRSEGEVRAAVDASRIRQVLINLLRNAADAFGDARGNIELAVEMHGNEARITVRDDGPGMSPEIAAKIFQPFVTTKGDKGLGLGLHISRQIVEAHGGTLTFETAPGNGTTFTVSLPRG
jgi:signal transduction histidine kinase